MSVRRVSSDVTPVVYLHAPDDRVAKGGTDIRVQRLFAGVAAIRPARLIEIGPGLDVMSQPSSFARGRAMLRGVPPRLSQRLGPSVSGRLEEVTRGAGTVVIGTTFCAPLLPRSLLGRCVLDAHNLEWRVVSQLAERAPHPRRWAYRSTIGWTRSYERDLARRVAGIWAVSDEEADWFRDAGARHVWVIPNGVDVPGPVGLPSVDPVLLFVGSLHSVFNRDGVGWFLSRCWPTIRATVPGARLLLVGRGSEDFGADGVDALGFVDELDGLYAGTTAAVVPLRMGAGTRLKVPEAMAHGRPVVSTPVGVEGLAVGEGDGVVMAAEPDAIIAACVDVLTHPARAARLGAAGRESAKARFEWAAIADRAAATLDELQP